jgi:hypothetical protein
MSDARGSDLGSILRDVTASTKRLSSHSKVAGHETSGFALSPIRAVFLDSTRWVVELTVKGSNLHLVPQSSVRGRANPTSQSYGRVTAFLRPRSANRAFAVEKRWPQHPFQCVEAKVARFCFLPMPLGTGTAKAGGLTTPPAHAHNVTQSRKICGSPRFALFRMAAL